MFLDIRCVSHSSVYNMEFICMFLDEYVFYIHP